MTLHIFLCPKCGMQHDWDEIPPLFCRKCGTVFDIKQKPESRSLIRQTIPEKKTRDDVTVPRTCPNCGQKISKTIVFCTECGTKLPPLNSPRNSSEAITKEEIITIYDTNAFRILGSSANIDRKSLRNIQQASKARAKLGGVSDTPDPLNFLKVIVRDENAVRESQNRIEVPKTRIHERCFWFVNANQNDAGALENLKSGQYNDAVHIWSASDELSAAINLAVLYHAYYLYKDVNIEKTEKWARVFERWHSLFNNEKYWEFLQGIEQQSEFEPPATIDDFNALKNDVWKTLLKPNTDCMKISIDRNLDALVKRHLDVMRGSNVPLRIINEIESEISCLIEKRIIEDLDETVKSVFSIPKSEKTTTGKKDDLDQLLKQFQEKTLIDIKRILRILGNEADISKNIREKTALCLRELAISYHNDAESFEQSKLVLVEARKFAEGTPIVSKINEDYSIIDKHVKNAQELEKYAEYNDTIGKDKLVITKDLIVFKKRRFWIKDITGIRYGIYQETVNGVPTRRSYAIWLNTDKPDSAPKVSFAGYIPPVSAAENEMMIECADALWFGIEKVETRFNEIVNRLYKLVQVPMINRMIQDFESGKRIYVSTIIIDFTGIYKEFSYGTLSKSMISLSSKYLGTKDVVTKEGKHKHLSWDNYRGYNISQGSIHLFDERGSWISFSLRNDWNAINLPPFLDYLNSEGNLAKAIDNCLSGITAVKDEQSEVIKTLDKSLEIDPKNSLTLLQKGRALKSLGRYEEAIGTFNQLLALQPKDPGIWNMLGLTYLESQKENEAIACFDHALDLDTKLAYVWYNRGMTFERLGKYQEAVLSLDRSLVIEFDQDIKKTRDAIQSHIPR